MRVGEVQVRPGTPGDYAAFVALFPELGVPEEPPAEARFLAHMLPDFQVAVDGRGDAAGVVWSRGRGPRWHVVHLIVDPRARRLGVGRALMAAAASRARAAGFTRWMLNVKPENDAARALYRGLGFEERLESASVRVDADALARLSGAPGLVVEPLPEAVTALPALGLAEGEPAAARALGRALLGARVGGDWVGCAAVDASFPGASPFRCARAGVAGPLAAAAWACCEPGIEALRLHVEGDPALERELVEAGAEVVMRVLGMEGEVPG